MILLLLFLMILLTRISFYEFYSPLSTEDTTKTESTVARAISDQTKNKDLLAPPHDSSNVSFKILTAQEDPLRKSGLDEGMTEAIQKVSKCNLSDFVLVEKTLLNRLKR